MRQRDFYILGLGCGGLLFSILTLVAGCGRGTMDNYAIAGYSYDLADGVVYPPLNATNSTIEYGVGPYASLIGNDIHWWFFTVHYLSLCGGYVGGTESPDYVFLQCERKAAGWRFRTDDPFIVHFLSFDEKPPVNSTVSLETFTTAPPIGTLATGIAFSVLSVGFLTAEAIGGWSKFGRLAQTSVWLLAGAATFLTISSALVTSISMRSERADIEYAGWIQHFEGVIWSAVAFMYIAFIWKLSDFMFQKERRRRLLTTGQI